MYKVVGVSCDLNKNIVYLSPNDLDLKINDAVIFDSDFGLQLGFVKTPIKELSDKNLNLPLLNVIRVALDDDLKKYNKNKKDCDIALKKVKKIVSDLELNMSFVNVYYNFDRSQMFFLYTSDERVDFRVLAKKLAQIYKTRIELRQIGVRDKAKKIGGLGPCGLFLCCNSFLSDFNSVSINMAKNQYLALNPSKINGVCGRLLCCLEYENDTYSELKKGLPKIGNFVETENGTGKVISVDVFKKSYKVDLNDKGVVELYLDNGE